MERFLPVAEKSPTDWKNFGVVTNIVTGPDGGLYVTSLSKGIIYMIR